MVCLSSKDPMLTLHQDVKSICKSLLSQTPISFFDYERYYFDGSYYCLTTNPELLTQYLSEDLYLIAADLENIDIRFAILSKNFPLPSIISEKNKLLRHTLMASELGVDFRLYMANAKENYIELFGFGFADSTAKTIEYSLNNLLLFEKLASDFCSQKPKIFNEIEKGKIILPDFFNNPNIKNELKVKLTKREQECLTYLAQGFTAKETGNILNISQRTVESYLENIKIKYNCYNKKQLKELYYNVKF